MSYYLALPETGGVYPEGALMLRAKDAKICEAVLTRLAAGIAGALNEQGDVPRLAARADLPRPGPPHPGTPEVAREEALPLHADLDLPRRPPRHHRRAAHDEG
jgi:hypothetical protein